MPLGMGMPQDKVARGVSTMGFWLEKFDDPTDVTSAPQAKNHNHDIHGHAFDRVLREVKYLKAFVSSSITSCVSDEKMVIEMDIWMLIARDLFYVACSSRILCS